METVSKDNVVNGFNIYKIISDSDTPSSLLSKLVRKINPLPKDVAAYKNNMDIDAKEDEIYTHYLHYFKQYNYWQPK